MLTGTAHFSLAELQRNTEWPIPAQYQDNAQATLEALEVVRAQLGGRPLVLTSLWRSFSANAALAGSVPNSRHLTAQAVDFYPVGGTLADAGRTWNRLQQDGQAPPFDQFLMESDHIHYDPGGDYGHRDQALAAVAGGWVSLASWVQDHPGLSVSAVLGVAAVVIFRGARVPFRLTDALA